MTQSVPPLVVVLLCVLGAGAVVTAFAAFGKSMFGSKDEPERDFYQRTPEQNSYLRRVRETNQVAIWGHARTQRRDQRRQRERDASDIEVQSGRSNSNVGGYGSNQYAYGNQGHFHSNRSPIYYENEYHGHDDPTHAYEEQHYQQPQQYQPPPRAYTGGRSSPYAAYQPKSGMVETYREVTR